MESILITGVAGFIGSHNSRAILRGGTPSLLASMIFRGRIENVPGNDVEFIEGDLEEIDAFQNPKGVPEEFCICRASSGRSVR